MGDHELTLYYSPMCPYCIRVRYFLSRQGITVPEKNTQRDPDAHRELIEVGGKGQVPALMIDGAILYESNDIIRWFKQHQAQPTGDR